jgi:hypothetical protein
MHPGLVFLILSTDPDFAADMTVMLRERKAEVYVATSFAEYHAIQAQVVVPEMLVVDPFFRVS